MSDLVPKISSELRSNLRPAKDNFLGFFHAIDWKDPKSISIQSIHFATPTYMDVDDYKKFLEYLTDELSRLKAKYSNEDVPDNRQVPVVLGNILNPPCSRSKGCGPSGNNTAGRSRRIQTCGICGATGHNRKGCPTLDVDGELGPHGFIQSTSVRLSNDS